VLRFDRMTTQRLVLRRWQPDDLDAFAALNADPEVMRYFPSTYDRSATEAMINAWEAKIQRQGFGLWAVERVEDGALLGMAGLNPVPPGIITGEGLEVGWRLARHAWGYGYATEAGRAAIDVARRIGGTVSLVVHHRRQRTLAGGHATARVELCPPFRPPPGPRRASGATARPLPTRPRRATRTPGAGRRYGPGRRGPASTSSAPARVATDLNGFRGVRTPEPDAQIAIRLATLPHNGPTGGYFGDAGEIPW